MSLLTPRVCALGALNAACTGLPEDGPPAVVKPGPDFARDCDQVAVYLASIERQRSSRGFGTDNLTPPTRATVPSIPVWTIVVVYSAVCLPIPNELGQVDEVAYNAAVCTYLDTAWNIYGAVVAAVRQGTLFGPGIFDLCLPPEAPTSCDGVTVGDIEFSGPSGDSAWCEFPVTFMLEHS